MRIVDVHRVADLPDGQAAYPEPGVEYRLRSLDEGPIDCGTVERVVRHGDTLFACTSSGQRFPVTGDHAAILIPARK